MPKARKTKPQQRDASASGDHEKFVTRSVFELRASTANREAGTIRATISTERAVLMFDWRSYQPIDEVLVTAGVEFEASLPMLDSHNRKRVNDVFGSVRDIQRLPDGTLDALLAFDLEDPEAKRAWNKVLGGHVRDVSVGYEVLKYVDIPAGETRTVNGRSFTAGTRTLRISQRWRLNEVSLTPIGADTAAKVRSHEQELEDEMNKRLLAFLRGLGLAVDASDEQVLAFRAKLDGTNATIASLLSFPEGDDTRSKMADVAIQALGRDVASPWKEAVREGSQSGTTGSGQTGQTGSTGATSGNGQSSVDPARALQDATAQGVEAERNRQRQIRELARLCGEAVDARQLQTALDDNWTTERAQTVFTTLVENRRATFADGTAPQGGNGTTDRGGNLEHMIRSTMGPACHTLNREQTHSALALAVSLARRMGADNIQPDQWFLRTPEGGGQRFEASRVPEPLLRAFDQSHRHSGMSLIDYARAALRMHGEEPSTYGKQAVLESLRTSGASSGSFTGLFSTAVYATLMQAYSMAPDVTGPITVETDVDDFRLNDLVRPETAVVLKRHKRGGKAEHIQMSDAVEQLRVWPFSGQWKVDWQDMVDDRLDTLNGMGPVALGAAARQLKPRLVVGMLLENANMRDGVALFHANHGNLGTGGMTATTLKTALTGLSKMSENGEPINNAGNVYAFCPPTLYWAAAQFRSGKISNDSGNGEENPLAGKYTPVQDARLELGVTHPTTDTVYAGSSSTWFAIKAASMAQGIIIAYLRGMNRLPMVRSKVLDGGEWGMQWDVLHTIGGKIPDWRGVFKTTA